LNNLPEVIEEKWPRADLERIQIERIPIDHSVETVNACGGSRAAQKLLFRFIEERLHDYAVLRNKPEKAYTSELSPYLHFGHISSHQVFNEIITLEKWSAAMLSPDTSGKRNGWWGMSQNAEAFLDQLITWRELGYNLCWQSSDYDQFSSLPEWARKTLSEHLNDRREYIYSLQEFEKAETHDVLWNAAQTQLCREGRIHNYLRMLWGKKILEWSRTPEEALQTMIELNNKYALDGRDPNSYSSIFWVLGRYDRPWGPERSIFGKVRYMTSENTARKYQVKNYIRKYSEGRHISRTLV
jgi:deoxyribodipyrimidine photo-lyase